MIKHKKFIVGLGGVAKSGKDTLCKMLIESFARKGVKAKRRALADPLKEQVRDSIIEKYGIDVLNCTPSEKETIRPELVAYGKKMRIESQGTHWTSLLDELSQEDGEDFIIVPDVRYSFYDNDEVQWVKNSGGFIIHVSRYYYEDNDAKMVLPPNEDEEKNDPLVKHASKFQICWPTCSAERLNNIYGKSLDIIVDFAKNEFINLNRRTASR